MGSINTATKNVFLSADVGWFGFDEFDDGVNGFDELSESWLVPIASKSKGNMSLFRKPVYISPTVIDSHNF